MKIKNRNISDLIASEYNPRQLTEKQHQDLTDSLKRFGMVDPIIVNQHPDRENIIIGGHMRLRIWKELGNETIPTVEVELNRDKERELNIRLNRNTGEWDWDALASEFDMDELTDWGFEASDLIEADWEDWSEGDKGGSSRTHAGSSTMLVCFGEFAGRVDPEIGERALEIIHGFDDDPDAAATALCEQVINHAS